MTVGDESKSRRYCRKNKVVVCEELHLLDEMKAGGYLLLGGSSWGSIRGKPLRKYSLLPSESSISVDEI